MTETARATGAANSDFKHALLTIQQCVEAALKQVLPDITSTPTHLHEAMTYATLGGGKRVRAVLVFGAGRAVGAPDRVLEAPAAALELIHAYSLVHDDLPCMDDDELRRGKPACHIAYDDATALLVGDALQSLAFQALAQAPGIEVARRLAMVEALAEASGSLGMAGGQAIDLASVGKSLNLSELQTMHRLKTGALIRASARIGGLAALAREDAALSALDDYASCVGLAFQIQDDILDVEGSTEALGKPQGADQALDKPTYPALLGLDASRRRAAELTEQAVAAIDRFGAAADLLRELAMFIVKRSN